MSTQYAVVWRPDATQVVRLIGPFRSHEKAQKVADRIDKLEQRAEAKGEWGGLDIFAEVVDLEAVTSSIADLREIVGLS